MVTTVKTWTATINRTLGSTTDQGVQYQNFMYEWSEQLILAGWTHVRSSNGTAVDTGTNLWTGPADIDWGVPTGESRSFIILQAPASWGAPVGADRFHLAIDCQNTSSDTTPQNCTVYFATNAITATTTSAALGFTSSRYHGFVSSISVLGWAAPAAARASFWRTSTGDVLWFTKLVSDAEFTRGGYVFDPIYARGSWRGIAGMATSTPTYTIPWTGGNTSGNSIGFTAAGASNSATAYPVTFVSPAHEFTSWGSGAIRGADNDGSVMFSQAIAGGNQTTQSIRRYYGTLPDIWFTQSDAFNLSDAGDTDPIVLRGFNNIALPVPTGTAALE